MQNVYKEIMENMNYNKFVVGNLLFVEYTCPITEDVWSVWTQNDYIIHVISGKKRLWTGTQQWTIKEGDTVYVKKGSYCMNQFFDTEFCMLGFFINDDFIRAVIDDLKGKIPINAKAGFENFKILRINHNPVLDGFFSSMYPFFKSDQEPSNSLLELKLKELIINILTTTNNKGLASYFQSLSETGKPSIRSVMENNFCHNLSISEFASMCHRSLSTFKRDFKTSFSTTPGKWLLQKRLDFSLVLLENEALNVSDVAFQSGFENSSHFSRSFKSKFGTSPSQYKSGG